MRAMPNDAEPHAPPVTLVHVAFDDKRVARLMQLYLHEWSAVFPDRVRIGHDALFAYPKPSDAVRAVLFLDDSAAPIGFALIERDAHGVTHVDEFFVLLGVRRRGFGAAAARALFDAEGGAWTLTVRPENPGALVFWRRVMGGAEEREEDGGDGVRRVRLTMGFHAPLGSIP
jgi:predicted acetyltransferase